MKWFEHQTDCELNKKFQKLEMHYQAQGGDGFFAAYGRVWLEFYRAKVPFLLLDDLGAEKVSDFTLQTLYDLLDRRYGECLETLITSNLTLGQLAEHYGLHGDRLASRIAGMGTTLAIKGKDRRWEG